MPIQGIEQPDFIVIDEHLRLRKFGGDFGFALKWYQDLETVWLIDGDEELYTPELLEEMYMDWNRVTEVYFIEVYANGRYIPIGDVSFNQKDMPIVIGEKEYRGRGIGTKVIRKLIERAKDLGYKEIEVEEIYHWNIASQKLYTKLGFKPNRKTTKGMSYKLTL